VGYKNSILLSDRLLSTSKIGQMRKLFTAYCVQGSIPEYIKHRQIDYLHALYESILYRDIIARYKLPQAHLIKTLVFYLASNCSKEITYSALRKVVGSGSSTTIADYCHYLENSYLCFFINRYSDSVKAQLQSPKKVYFIDPVLAKTVGFRISEDVGRLLENIVFLELKRRYKEIYYYKGLKECDFIVRENTKTIQVIQVCKDISDPQTRKREIDGLVEAMIRFDLHEGVILTESAESTEHIKKDGISFKITVMPIWKWLIM
jgi:uncharacterized protein